MSPVPDAAGIRGARGLRGVLDHVRRWVRDVEQRVEVARHEPMQVMDDDSPGRGVMAATSASHRARRCQAIPATGRTPALLNALATTTQV